MNSRKFNRLFAFLVCLSLIASSAAATFQRASIRSDNLGLAATAEVLKSVSALRGLDIKNPVKSSERTKDQIEQFVMRDLDENTPAAELAATTKLMVKLGLVQRGFGLRDYMIKLLREQVAGFYDPKTKEFYLAAWLPLSEQKKVMAHELVHALQDQHFNLRRFEKWPKGDSDAELAVHALIEGDATLLMIQYEFNEQGANLDVRRLQSVTDAMLVENEDEDVKQYPIMSAAPRVLRETLQFPYVYGAGFAQAIWRDGSLSELNRSYVDLPTSTEQIMHPARFLNRDNPIKVHIPTLTNALGNRWKEIDRDVSGEFGYQVLLAQFLARAEARKAAEGWGGDQYVLYERPGSDDLLLVQFTTWDRPSDAREFFQAYCNRTRRRYRLEDAAESGDSTVYSTNEGLASVQLRGADVAVVEGASSREELSAILEALWQSKKSAR